MLHMKMQCNNEKRRRSYGSVGRTLICISIHARRPGRREAVHHTTTRPDARTTAVKYANDVFLIILVVSGCCSGEKSVDGSSFLLVRATFSSCYISVRFHPRVSKFRVLVLQHPCQLRTDGLAVLAIPSTSFGVRS